MRGWLRVLILGAMLVLGPGGGGLLIAAEADPFAENLRQSNPPWYDTTKDDYRPVLPTAPPPPPAQGTTTTGQSGQGRTWWEWFWGTDSGNSSGGNTPPPPAGGGGTTGGGGGGGTTGSGGGGGGGTSVGMGAPGAGPFALLMYVVVAAAVIALLVVIIRALVQYRRAASTQQQGTQSQRVAMARRELPLELGEHEAPLPDDLESALDQAIRQGDYRRAVILAYADMLAMLDQADLIRLRKGTTNRGYLRELQRRKVAKPIQQHLGEVIDIFERVYFGHVPAAQIDASRCAQAVAGMRDRLPTAVAA